MAKQSLALIAAVVFLYASVPVRGQRGAPPPAMPDGEGKELAQTLCTKCHAINLVTNSYGYTREGWEQLFQSMVQVPKDQSATLSAYLAKNFPEKPRPRAVLIPGSATVSIKEWVVPSLGSRPHDPLSTPDGAIWW